MSNWEKYKDYTVGMYIPVSVYIIEKDAVECRNGMIMQVIKRCDSIIFHVNVKGRYYTTRRIYNK